MSDYLHSSQNSSHPTSSSRYHSRNTIDTAISASSLGQPGCKHADAAAAGLSAPTSSHTSLKDPKVSVETYATTVLSDIHQNHPELKARTSSLKNGAQSILTSTPTEFAQLFPSKRRIHIQHDISASDGEMNLRLDTQIDAPNGQQIRMILFHLRMQSLHDRSFSFRRYSRDSGREICSSKRKYLKPTPQRRRSAEFLPRRSVTAALHRLKTLARSRNVTSESAEGVSDDENNLQCFTRQADVEATIPTSTIHLEFSNYLQVEMHPFKQGAVKFFGFEYWGVHYSWRRQVHHEHRKCYFSLHLHQDSPGRRIAEIMPERHKWSELQFEDAQRRWIPESSMRLLHGSISPDLADIIVATGLIALTDNCIRHRRKHRSEDVKLGIDKISFTDF